jgi:hypothetical protein
MIRVIMGSSSRDSCWELFKNFEVLPLQSQYIFSLLVFVVKNRKLFRPNADVHNINARYNSDLHLPVDNFTVLQKGVFYF